MQLWVPGKSPAAGRRLGSPYSFWRPSSRRATSETNSKEVGPPVSMRPCQPGSVAGRTIAYRCDHSMPRHGRSTAPSQPATARKPQELRPNTPRLLAAASPRFPAVAQQRRALFVVVALSAYSAIPSGMPDDSHCPQRATLVEAWSHTSLPRQGSIPLGRR